MPGEIVEERIEALQFLTSDIRDNKFSSRPRRTRLERKGSPPQVIEISRSQTKGGAGRPYYQCPLCRKKAILLYYPYAGRYIDDSWRCRKCLEKYCGNTRWVFYEAFGEIKTAMLSEKFQMYGNQGNGKSHQRVTPHIIRLMRKAGAEVDQATIDGFNGWKIIEWPYSEEETQSVIRQELRALLRLRNQIIEKKTEFSRKALDRVLAEAHRQEKE